MSRSRLRFYLDENMNPEIAYQLVQHGIDTLAARDAGMLTTTDLEQLRIATEMGRVICTEDSDFVDPAKFKLEHAGIAFFSNSNRGIGYMIKALQNLHQSETAETMKNSLRYL